jgi:hypothetical protein
MKKVVYEPFKPKEKEEEYQGFKVSIENKHTVEHPDLIPLDSRVFSVKIYKEEGNVILINIKYIVGENCKFIFQCFHKNPITLETVKKISYYILIDNGNAHFKGLWYDLTYEFENAEYFEFHYEEE